VPAAMAMGEKNDCDGETFLKSVVLGYDVGSRVMRGLRPKDPFEGDRGRGWLQSGQPPILKMTRWMDA